MCNKLFDIVTGSESYDTLEEIASIGREANTYRSSNLGLFAVRSMHYHGALSFREVVPPGYAL